MIQLALEARPSFQVAGQNGDSKRQGTRKGLRESNEGARGGARGRNGLSRGSKATTSELVDVDVLHSLRGNYIYILYTPRT